jgi:hypothetical protein
MILESSERAPENVIGHCLEHRPVYASPLSEQSDLTRCDAALLRDCLDD